MRSSPIVGQYSASDHLLGRQVLYWGHIWTVVGKNFLGDWDVERFEFRADGRYRLTSSIRPHSLPAVHPHFSEVLPRGIYLPVEPTWESRPESGQAGEAATFRRDAYAFRLWSKAQAGWQRAERMLGVVRDNAKNRRRYNRHIGESNRLMLKLQRIGALRTPLGTSERTGGG